MVQIFVQEIKTFPEVKILILSCLFAGKIKDKNTKQVLLGVSVWHYCSTRFAFADDGVLYNLT